LLTITYTQVASHTSLPGVWMQLDSLNSNALQSCAALRTVEGSIKGEHVSVPPWGYWSGLDCTWDL